MSKYKNNSLNHAKKMKNDEFYTPFSEISNLFDSVNTDIFKGKSLLLPCDDFRISQFYKYFKERFHDLGLLNLEAVGYKENSRGILCKYNGVIEQVKTLDGNGDFRLYETQEKIEKADIVITNPPYSLFKDIFVNLIAKNKKFLLVAPIHGLHYVDVFPLIKTGEIQTSYKDIRQFILPNGELAYPSRSVWLGNMINFEKPFLNCTYSIKDYAYQEYNNIKALEIPYAKMIPHDYYGVMGVPSTFLSKLNIQQFEILALDSEIYKLFPEYVKKWSEKHRKDKPYFQGKMCYSRIFIQHRNSNLLKTLI